MLMFTTECVPTRKSAN